MSIPIERTVKAQLSTARMLLAMFDEQLGDGRRMGAKQRRGTARGRDLGSRLDGLKAGRAKWAARVAALEARAATED